MDFFVHHPTMEWMQYGKRRMGVFLLSVLAIYALANVATLSRSPMYDDGDGVTRLHPQTESAIESPRELSVDLGDGRCRYVNPMETVPAWLDLHKTLIPGFPSGGKKMVFMQMEALAGLPARDEWDFKIYGMTNHPFIKTNYPHHEGIWELYSADQTVLMLRSIRSCLIEYHDIMYDFGYPASYEQAKAERELNVQRLYTNPPPEEAFLAWRDERLLIECSWFSWYIDFWMEGGLYRDIFSHRMTTAFHWNRVTKPLSFTIEQRDFDLVVGNVTVTPTYDPHCINGDVTEGCAPKAVISTEKLYSNDVGHLETNAIANVLLSNDKTGEYVISSETWTCIWEELVKKKKGGITVFDRPDTFKERYFSAEMLEKMIQELTYLIDKYNGANWNLESNANRLVELLVEDRARIQIELDDVNSGRRRELSDRDFLGPKERAQRRVHALKEDSLTGNIAAAETEPDFTPVFEEMARRRNSERKKRLIAARDKGERPTSPSAWQGFKNLREKRKRKKIKNKKK